MTRIITLKYSGKCKVCGARMRRGDSAMWYGKGRGVSCLHHGTSATVSYARMNSGAVVVSCTCEDYPCCGH